MNSMQMLTKIPNLEPNILVCNGFHIESDCWNRCHYFPLMQSIQNCGLSSVIQA